ncbi:CaiB/BaiF CoA-transferase family protein [Neobacillus novalis]|uniref:CaiB/BaiF CoA-transferase family protein n=1 Tax=Neobacillus novalis TaxID=220687 RepID=A0AA95MWC6_9BACI|nr:CaiB/BaiF CoA-transferase family protein [Neobacillus novalis]WHY88898.1 CaiB/BaiF CoA-transferase family protein [Neobacillus novalis]
MAGALEGLKILDFSTLVPGPYATMCLADMGADVLRIKSGTRPDVVDFLPPFLPETMLSSVSAQLSRNKKLMTLNLKDSRAREVIHQLLGEYDIIIEQFRPGVMAKLHLDYESLKKVNPRLIYCSLTGYGQTGPMRTRAGHDINYIAMSGVASYSGKKESGPPLLGVQIGDIASGSNNAIIGILSAVIYRERTGKGQHIDVSMTDGMIAFNSFMQGAAYLVDGKDVGMEENLVNGGSLYDYYETQDGRYLSFGGVEPQFFKQFCQTIGRPDFATGGVTPKNGTAIKEEIRQIIRTRTLEDWMDLFNEADACVEPVLKLSEVLDSPLVRERGMVVEVPGPNGNKIKQIANPIKFSESLPEYRHTGIPLSQANTDAIMKSLGYSQTEIEELANTGLFS